MRVGRSTGSVLPALAVVAGIYAGGVLRAAESADYACTPQGVTCGGGAHTSACYAAYASAGGVLGVSTSTLPSRARQGLVAQLYELDELAVTFASTGVDEAGSRQATAHGVVDDGSVLVLGPTDPDWSVGGWPLASVSTGGLVQAGTVYADCLGTVYASYGGLLGSGLLTVRNVGADDFGTYAGDGLDDDWQVLHFGVSNAAAAPGVDADLDEQDNELEFYALTDPTNTASRLLFWVEPVPGATQQVDVCFAPHRTARVYTVRACTNLLGTPAWVAVNGPLEDAGIQRTLTDTNAVESVKFYRLWIGRP